MGTQVIRVQHRMGTSTGGVQNIVANVLSRNPVGNLDGSQISCAALRALALNSREQLIREQREDPELGHIYRYLENPDDGSVNATICEGWSQDFKVLDGLLFYAKYSTTLGELRVYIPRSLREAIMKEFHELPLAGHLGKRKTYLKFCDTCYFPYMRKYIFEYVSTCDRCQKFNYKNALPAGRLISIVSNYPNEIVTFQVIYSQFGLAIHQNDHQARRRFVEWAQNEIAAVPDFHKRILFSDEAHFWLNGYANKQNCRIWSEANPQVYVETPLHPEKLTVWCALWAGGIIGPYFFKNDEGHNVTVNGDRYKAIITNFFIPELNNPDVQELWFQQDGATCHTARATIDLLKDTFGDRLISRFGPVNWPPRSCDLTPLDYFLWGYVKSLVYANKPQTLDHLKDNIRRVVADIRPQMLEKVIENRTSRLDYIQASHGSHMPEIIFKM
ncbi:uncharacterized protein TNCV_73431 [Trichonephila clavipes]|nr:uncharacterized protein TNCV_73431 [Trichonephila clavipes]